MTKPSFPLSLRRKPSTRDPLTQPHVWQYVSGALLALSGCAGTVPCKTTAPSTPTSADYVADLDQLLSTLAGQYAYADERPVDWVATRQRLLPRAAAVRGRSEFIPVLEEAIDELHDAHANLGTNTDHSFRLVPSGTDIWAEFVGSKPMITEVRPGSAAARALVRPGEEIVSVNGVPVAQAIDVRLGRTTTAPPSARPSASAPTREWALRSLLAGRHDEPRRLTLASPSGQREITLQGEEGHDAEQKLEFRRLPSGVGLIRVHNSLGDDELVPAFDAALAALADSPALILDLRDTPSGGNTGVAEAVMGRFIRQAAAYQRYELPKAGWKDRSRLWDQYVTPRGPFTYEKPLAVLVDHWTGSMGEGMAIGFDALKRAVVVGTRMAGLNGAVYSVTLDKTGISFSAPAERLFHINGTPRHLWVPPVLLDLSGIDAFAADPIVDRAVAVLASPQTTPTSDAGKAGSPAPSGR